jgi:hypothetical protein
VNTEKRRPWQRGNRQLFRVVFALSAVLVAAFLAWFTRDVLSASDESVRDAAVMDAAVVGMLYLLSR